MVDMVALTQELHSRVEWQKTPEEVFREDLMAFVMLGIRDLFIMTGRAAQYSEDLYETEDGIPTMFSGDLLSDEREYVLIAGQIAFFNKVKTDVNKHIGYTTDALSVTHADKPFRYLSETISELDRQKRTIWFKMARYTI